MLRLISGFKDLKVWETREGALRLKSEGRVDGEFRCFYFFVFTHPGPPSDESVCRKFHSSTKHHSLFHQFKMNLVMLSSLLTWNWTFLTVMVIYFHSA